MGGNHSTGQISQIPEFSCPLASKHLAKLKTMRRDAILLV
jgi:hypothetical protein